MGTWIFYCGAFIALALACAMTAANVGTAPDASSLLLGAVVAFFCALLAIYLDMQASIKKRLGSRADMFVFNSRIGIVCVIGWGAFTVFMFQLVQKYPDWASSTFHFKVNDNIITSGLTVGLSALVIIRSKLAKVNDIEIGGEWVYLWSSAKVLDAVNRKWIADKAALEAKFTAAIRDLAAFPNFFTDLETHVLGILAGLDPTLQTSFQNELANLKANVVPKGTANPAAFLDGSIPARKSLVSIVIDYLGRKEMIDWGRARKIAA